MTNEQTLETVAALLTQAIIRNQGNVNPDNAVETFQSVRRLLQLKEAAGATSEAPPNP